MHMKTAITCFALAIIANTSPLTDAYQKDKGLSILSRQEDVTDVPDFTDGPTWNLALTGSNAQSTVDWVWYDNATDPNLPWPNYHFADGHFGDTTYQGMKDDVAQAITTQTGRNRVYDYIVSDMESTQAKIQDLITAQSANNDSPNPSLRSTDEMRRKLLLTEPQRAIAVMALGGIAKGGIVLAITEIGQAISTDIHIRNAAASLAGIVDFWLSAYVTWMAANQVTAFRRLTAAVNPLVVAHAAANLVQTATDALQNNPSPGWLFNMQNFQDGLNNVLGGDLGGCFATPVQGTPEEVQNVAWAGGVTIPARTAQHCDAV